MVTEMHIKKADVSENNIIIIIILLACWDI